VFQVNSSASKSTFEENTLRTLDSQPDEYSIDDYDNWSDSDLSSFDCDEDMVDGTPEASHASTPVPQADLSSPQHSAPRMGKVIGIKNAAYKTWVASAPFILHPLLTIDPAPDTEHFYCIYTLDESILDHCLTMARRRTWRQECRIRLPGRFIGLQIR
jgi:hypothetical protein